MSVDGYQAKFNALSRFASHMVSDEGKKVRRFHKRLKFSIRNKVVPLRLQSFDEALATAQLIKQDPEEQKQEVEYPRGKTNTATSQPYHQRSDQRGRQTTYEGRNQTCDRCGRNHGGRECY